MLVISGGREEKKEREATGYVGGKEAWSLQVMGRSNRAMGKGMASCSCPRPPRNTNICD